MLGANKVEILSEGSWWVLTSDYNWLTRDDRFTDPVTPFKRISSDEKLGQNSCFGEIVLAAFCVSIVVYERNIKLFKISIDKKIPEKMQVLYDRDMSLFFNVE